MGNLFISGTNHYEFIDTADGSPSICMWDSSSTSRPEAMHHRKGALTESLYVYEGLLIEALQRGCAPSILSVGIGCGYNEMIVVAYLLKHNFDFKNVYIESFEGSDELRHGFILWLTRNSSTQHDPFIIRLFKTLDLVLEKIANNFSIEPMSIVQKINDLRATNKFIIRKWLTLETKFDTKFGVIFFDAFSSKSSPQLWTDQFLKSFLNEASAPTCGIATYAATGSLNRALRHSQFVLKNQPGFAGKRQSTRAFKIAADVDELKFA